MSQADLEIVILLPQLLKYAPHKQGVLNASVCLILHSVLWTTKMDQTWIPRLWKSFQVWRVESGECVTVTTGLSQSTVLKKKEVGSSDGWGVGKGAGKLPREVIFAFSHQ